MNKNIEQVSVQEILPLRQKVLRPGKSLRESTFEGDYGSATFHLAWKQDRKIRAVASFMQQEYTGFPSKNQYRLRGMAVAEAEQRKGLGSQLLKEGILILGTKKCQLLWFNARIGAVRFYKIHGFIPQGEIFEIPGVGPHFLMYKKL